MKNFKLSLAILVALCLLISVFVVACNDGDDAAADTTEVGSVSAIESGSDASSDTSSDTSDTEKAGGTTEAQVAQTIGASGELSDDGFVKVSWGDCEK